MAELLDPFRLGRSLSYPMGAFVPTRNLLFLLSPDVDLFK
jgi:hypothetical protein